MASNIQTMSSLYVEITRLLDGEDPTVSDLSVPTLARLVNVAEKRVYRDTRSRFNEKPFSGVTITDNIAPLPDDYKDASLIHLGRQALIPVSENVIHDYWNVGFGGIAKFVARAGSGLTFWPPVADGEVLQGRYWFAYPNLSDDNIATNKLFQEADDAFIYGALVESAPFFGARQDLPTWESKYQSIVLSLNMESKKTTYSAGRMMMRSSAGVIEGRDNRYGYGQLDVVAFDEAEDGSLLGVD